MVESYFEKTRNILFLVIAYIPHNQIARASRTTMLLSSKQWDLLLLVYFNKKALGTDNVIVNNEGHVRSIGLFIQK
jgi:hypothetical protein